MPAQRLSMRQVREVLRLKWACGLSDRKIAHSLRVRGIHVTRDRVASVRYSERLNSSKSSFSFQRTDRYGIVGQKHSHFQRDS